MNIVFLLVVLTLLFSGVNGDAFARLHEPNMRRYHDSAPRWFLLGSWATYRRRMRVGLVIVSGIMAVILTWGVGINVAALFD